MILPSLARSAFGLKGVIFSTKKFTIESTTEAYDSEFDVSGAAAALEHATKNPDVPLNANRLNHAPHATAHQLTTSAVIAEFDSKMLVEWLNSVHRVCF